MFENKKKIQELWKWNTILFLFFPLQQCEDAAQKWIIEGREREKKWARATIDEMRQGMGWKVECVGFWIHTRTC